MGLRIQERGEVVRGEPVVQPGDDLFWFKRPRLILYLINFVLFQVPKVVLLCIDLYLIKRMHILNVFLIFIQFKSGYVINADKISTK